MSISRRVLTLLFLLGVFFTINSKAQTTITEEPTVDFAVLFRTIDTNGDGAMCVQEFVEYLKNDYEKVMDAESLSEFNRLDLDKNKVLDFNELLQSLNLTKTDPSYKSVEERFHSADTDKDGTLNLPEIRNMMNHNDSDMAPEFLNAHDADNDGHLSFEEVMSPFKENERPQVEKDVRSAFDRADENKDGKLSLNETVALLQIAQEDNPSMSTATGRRILFTRRFEELVGNVDKAVKFEEVSDSLKEALIKGFSHFTQNESSTPSVPSSTGDGGEENFDIDELYKQLAAMGYNIDDLKKEFEENLNEQLDNDLNGEDAPDVAVIPEDVKEPNLKDEL